MAISEDSLDDDIEIDCDKHNKNLNKFKKDEKINIRSLNDKQNHLVKDFPNTKCNLILQNIGNLDTRYFFKNIQ